MQTPSVFEPKYRYSEDVFMKDMMDHVDKTNQGHYSGEIQTVEYIMSRATTFDYLVGNIDKYISRFGKKNGYNLEDIYKACHYLMMMAHYAKKKEKISK